MMLEMITMIVILLQSPISLKNLSIDEWRGSIENVHPIKSDVDQVHLVNGL